MVVHGSESTLVIDPSLSLDRDPVGADLVFVSHGHEDHIAGLRHFDTPAYAHHLDAPAVASLDTMLTNYGLPPNERVEVQQSIATQYGIPPTHENVSGIAGGHVFDLGDRTATVIHLPGHTRGHCGVLVEPDGFFYVADIDLTSFGPMYATWVAASTTSSTPSTTSQRSTHAGTEHSIRRAWSRAATSSVAGCPHTATNY